MNRWTRFLIHRDSEQPFPHRESGRDIADQDPALDAFLRAKRIRHTAKSSEPDRMRQTITPFFCSVDNVDMIQVTTMERGDGVAGNPGYPDK